jgi:hypothetical protein
MKVVLGCDVDPALPAPLVRRPDADIWRCLDNIDYLLERACDQLPPITWLIRSDESVRFATDRFDSGYQAKASLWQSLVRRGHELGWHFHAMSYDASRRRFGFDPELPWLEAAREALAGHFDVRATRTGWDYCSNGIVGRLDAMGVAVDFSALPGNIVWQQAGDDRVEIDWLRCPSEPYHPSALDYQQAGSLSLLEVPIAQFANSAFGMITRLCWRLKNGNRSMAGVGNKTRMLTQPWSALPRAAGVWAFYFHPEDLTDRGIAHALRNIATLRDLGGVEFVRASDLA